MAKHPMDASIRLEQVVALELEPGLRRRAQEHLGQGPGLASWRLLLSRLTLYVGTALTLAGVICFFAFNWRGLHRFGKFGVVAALLAAAILLAWRTERTRLPGKVALAAACVLAGVWLAVVGQVYQTGADAFELFRAWALVILPWVLLARFQALWAFWVLLLNLWLGLWWSQVGGPSGTTVWWAFTGLNGSAWVLREALQDRWPWLRGRWLPRALVLPTLGLPLGMALNWIAMFPRRQSGPGGLALTLVLGGALVVLGRQWRRDLFMVTAGLGAGIALFTAFLAKALLEGRRGSGGCDLFILIGLALAAQVGGAASWLRMLHREEQS